MQIMTYFLQFLRYKIFEIDEYTLPNSKEWSEHCDHILSFPLESTPSVFGLHNNATMAKNARETEQVFLLQHL